MNTIDISYLGLGVGLLLLAMPIYFFHRLGVRLVRSTVIAAVRMVVQLFLIGLYLKYLFEWNDPWINLAWVALIVLVASFTVAQRTRLRFGFAVVPLFGGFCGSVIGLLVGNMLGVSVMALNTYYDGLQGDRRLYYYLLGNGASHVEAVMPFVRRAVEKSFAPCVANMAVMGIVAMPGTMIGQILGGSVPGVAIKYQMMIVVIAFVASALSLVVTLYLADRRSFDIYGRLKDIRRRS